jgi:uncharacterized protein (UPF0276 family)
MSPEHSSALSAGLSLKPQHFDAATRCRAGGLWFEVHPENYMVDGGPRLRWLEAVRAEHALSLHGVSLSLGGEEPLDTAHLQRLAQLVQRLQPALVSEHLAWSRWEGVYFPDLLPFPRTSTTLQRMAAHIDQTQSALGRSIAIENPSHYLQVPQHTWDETDFLAELVRRTGCSLLLDVNNVHVSSRNLGFSASDYLARFPVHAVSEIHLAGHTPDPTLGNGLLIDSHDAPVAPEVWALYEDLVARIGPRPTLIERDGNVPTFEELWVERSHAERLLTSALAQQVAA